MSKAARGITFHLETPDQGGLEYARCEECGREGIGSILHKQGCSNR